MKLPSLIQIESELSAINNDIMSNDGLINEVQEAQLKALLIMEKDKVDAYCMMLDRIESETTFVEQRIEEAKNYIKRLQSVKENMSRIALSGINQKGEKLIGTTGRYMTTRKSKKVIVQDDTLLTDEYLRTKHTQEADKVKIKEALEKGEAVPGCHLEENVSLQWK
jgi:Siphovirus Gp157